MKTSTTKLGGSTFSFMWQESALSAMRKMQALGLNDFDVIMVPGHLWHDEMTAHARSLLAATLSHEGIRIESLNLPALDQNLVSRVPEARAYAVNLYTKTLQLSADLGSHGVVVVPGRVSSLFPPPQEGSEALLLQSLEALLDIADRLDQTIHVELHPQTPVSTAKKLNTFLKAIDHPKLRVAYDVSNAEFVGEDQVESLQVLAPRLGQIHLSDGTKTSWRHDRLGAGTVRFQPILQMLEHIGFEGIVVLEIISPDAIADIEHSLRYLKGLPSTS